MVDPQKVDRNWYPMHEHETVDGEGFKHSHHRDNGGHGSHDHVELTTRELGDPGYIGYQGGGVAGPEGVRGPEGVQGPLGVALDDVLRMNAEDEAAIEAAKTNDPAERLRVFLSTLEYRKKIIEAGASHALGVLGEVKQWFEYALRLEQRVIVMEDELEGAINLLAQANRLINSTVAPDDATMRVRDSWNREVEPYIGDK